MSSFAWATSIMATYMPLYFLKLEIIRGTGLKYTLYFAEIPFCETSFEKTLITSFLSSFPKLSRPIEYKSLCELRFQRLKILFHLFKLFGTQKKCFRKILSKWKSCRYFQWIREVAFVLSTSISGLSSSKDANQELSFYHALLVLVSRGWHIKP